MKGLCFIERLFSQLKIDLLTYMNIYLCVCDIYTYIHIYTHTYVSISYMNTSLLCFQAVFFIVFQMVKLYNVLVTCGRWQVILLIKNTAARVQTSPEQCCWYKPLAALFPRPNHCETTKTFYPAWVVTQSSSCFLSEAYSCNFNLTCIILKYRIQQCV